jgi:hypothetical protein
MGAGNPLRLHQSAEIFNREITLTEDRSQCAPVQFVMVRDNCLREGIISAEDDVTAVLPSNAKAHLL